MAVEAGLGLNTLVLLVRGNIYSLVADGKYVFGSRWKLEIHLVFESEQVDTSAFMTPEKLQQGVASILEEVMP